MGYPAGCWFRIRLWQPYDRKKWAWHYIANRYDDGIWKRSVRKKDAVLFDEESMTRIRLPLMKTWQIGIDVLPPSASGRKWTQHEDARLSPAAPAPGIADRLPPDRRTST